LLFAQACSLGGDEVAAYVTLVASSAATSAAPAIMKFVRRRAQELCRLIIVPSQRSHQCGADGTGT
jgi:hypothetical protein